jgi:hypothetical protein
MKLKSRDWLFVAVAAVLAAVYVIYFSDWFKPKTIHISHTYRVTPAATRLAQNTGAIITFGFNRPLQITEITVVAVESAQTNRPASPLWHLVSSSNSAPVRSFVYGQPIRGLQPYLKGTRAQPLETNALYRIIVAAGKIHGEHDFRLGNVAVPKK